MDRYIKSKWTSVKKKYGWRHYEVKNVFKKKKELEMFSACDDKISFIIKLEDIKNRKQWVPGWKKIV